MITELPRHDPEPVVDPDRPDNREHPMRLVTESVVADPSSWTREQAGRVEAVFDDLAAGWTERFAGEDHLLALADALDRGDVKGSQVLEIGSGTGMATAMLAARFGRVMAVDLSAAMLRHAPAGVGCRVQADGSRLPVPDASADVVVLVNAFLFPDEVDRVLSASGAVVWVNSVGARTPIHLPADQVDAALPGAWHGVASSAGEGTWCVLRRSAGVGTAKA